MTLKTRKFKMKERPRNFLSKDNIDHSSEAFDYIKELHEILWRICRGHGASLDLAIENYLNGRSSDEHFAD